MKIYLDHGFVRLLSITVFAIALAYANYIFEFEWYVTVMGIAFMFLILSSIPGVPVVSVVQTQGNPVFLGKKTRDGLFTVVREEQCPDGLWNLIAVRTEGVDPCARLHDLLIAIKVYPNGRYLAIGTHKNDIMV